MSATGTTLSPTAGERFEAYAEKLTLSWVLDAISETAAANVKAPRYTYRILDRWAVEGRKDKAPPAVDSGLDLARVLRNEGDGYGQPDPNRPVFRDPFDDELAAIVREKSKP
jgi:hypothetical protein